MDNLFSDNYNLPYNISEFLHFKTKGEEMFIRKTDISYVRFFYDESTNNQLKVYIILANGLKVVHGFHKNNYNEYKDLCDVFSTRDRISEEEWHKTMKVSYK